MNPKLNALRALAAFSALQSLRLLTIAFSIVTALVVVIIGLLSYFLSPWWLVFLIPVAVVVLILVGLRIAIKAIVNHIHRHPFTTRQREHLESFTSHLNTLAEVKNTPVFIYALSSLWDILRYRDESAIQELIENSKSLKIEFAELEKQFGER